MGIYYIKVADREEIINTLLFMYAIENSIIFFFLFEEIEKINVTLIGSFVFK